MIKSTPRLERPRERCLNHGASCLSLRECIAVILGTGPKEQGCLGLADAIIKKSSDGMPSPECEYAYFTAMESTPLSILENIEGLGPAGRAKLIAAFEIGRRYSAHRDRHSRPAGKIPEFLAAIKIPEQLRCAPKEWLGFIPIYKSGKTGKVCIVENGVRTHVNTDPGELFGRILALRPSAFILIHNHPSGDHRPSTADHNITHLTCKLAAQLGVGFLGHYIVSTKGESWIETPV